MSPNIGAIGIVFGDCCTPEHFCQLIAQEVRYIDTKGNVYVCNPMDVADRFYGDDLNGVVGGHFELVLRPDVEGPTRFDIYKKFEPLDDSVSCAEWSIAGHKIGVLYSMWGIFVEVFDGLDCDQNKSIDVQKFIELNELLIRLKAEGRVHDDAYFGSACNSC